MYYFIFIYFNNHPLRVFRIDQLFIIRGYFTVYAAYGVYYPTLIVLAASQRTCTINIICCTVTLLPDGE